MKEIARTCVAIALALALAACGDDNRDSVEAGSTSTTSAAATTANSTTPAAEPVDEGADEPDRDPAESEGEPVAAASAEVAIRAVLTADGDPEQACTAFVTEDFVATAYGGRANCVAARRPNALAESLQISDEGGGEFTVVPSGGPYDGVEVRVEVIDEGGYRVSSLLADIPAGP